MAGDMRLPTLPRQKTNRRHRANAEPQLPIGDRGPTALLAMESPPSDNLVPLTPRELEALQWTAEGKTAWEVGEILGISEQTASRHLSNATRKLDCVNKYHAVVKAMRMGLVR